MRLGIRQSSRFSARLDDGTVTISADGSVSSRADWRRPSPTVRGRTTSIPKEEAELIFQHADVATGCASKYIRETGAAWQAFKVGDSVPMFGITPRGVHLIQERIKFMGKEIKANPQAPQPDRLL